MDTEHDNLRAAFAWVSGSGDDLESACRLSAALWTFWEFRYHTREAEEWIGRLLPQREALSPFQQARLLEAAGSVICSYARPAEAIPLLEESVALYRSLGHEQGETSALCTLAVSYRDHSEYARAQALFETCLPRFRARNDLAGIAKTLTGLGLVARAKQEITKACSLLEEGATLFRILGDQHSMAWCTFMQGRIAREQKENVMAELLFQEALELFGALDDRLWTVYSLHHLCELRQERDDPTATRNYCHRGWRLSRAMGAARWEVTFLVWLGDLDWAETRSAEAQARYQEALRVGERSRHKPGVRKILHRLADLAAAQGRRERAIRLLYAAEKITEQMTIDLPDHPASLPPADRKALARALDRTIHAEAERTGRTFTREQALAYALSPN